MAKGTHVTLDQIEFYKQDLLCYGNEVTSVLQTLAALLFLSWEMLIIMAMIMKHSSRNP